MKTKTGFEIAIIGMDGKFPGAPNIDSFWSNLKNGVESISFFSDKELNESDISEEMLNHPNYVRSNGGILEGKEYFDASFFSYSPREAEIMDPQLRILHECTWHALEHAGYNPHSYNGSIGFYSGASDNLDWRAAAILSGKNSKLGLYNSMHLTQRDFFNTHISYKLNLQGPVVLVQTACSTSLVAIHLACRALLMRECDIALAGGVSISSSTNYGYIYEEGMINSVDGHCRTFDTLASGTIGGDGVGVVVLKRLKYAISDGDNIYAIIKGTGINNDGVRKIGFTAPSISAQVELIKRVQQLAQVNPESITYIEAHGTGTALGDPVEVEALSRAFGSHQKKFCGIGSVKTNIGHLDVAAGVASVIKTVLALIHKQLPPSLNFEKANPRINFENSPFYVVNKLTTWKNKRNPLRAGINSLGIGGTNAHIILEEAPVRDNSCLGRPFQLLLLSAKTEKCLKSLTENLLKHFKSHPTEKIADLAYTLHEGRYSLPHRRFLVCNDVKDAIQKFTTTTPKSWNSFYVKEEDRPVAFMFPGQGAQYMNMTLGLYETEPVFRKEMDICFEILNPLVGDDIKEVLFCYNDSVGKKNIGYDVKNDHAWRINQTQYTQPLIFCVEYALSKLLIDWGITPDAMIGHSIGEYVAACISGVFSLNDALKLIAQRGRLIQEMPPGDMLSVSLTEKEINYLLLEHKDLELAAVNSPTSCVISGTQKAVQSLARQLIKNGVNCRQLLTSHAFHSKMMDPILIKFEKSLREIDLMSPIVPYISSQTGNWITSEEAKDPYYWIKQLRGTVRFNDGLKKLLMNPNFIFIEVGPGRSLSTFVRQHPDKKKEQKVVNLVPHPKEEDSDVSFLLNRIGDLWLFGKKVKGERFYAGQKRNRIPLPKYPFRKQYFWINLNTKKSSITPQYSLVREMENNEKIEETETLLDIYQRPEITTPLVSPRNESEKKLVKIWQEFFAIDNVGIYDNFFELGGDSLKAVQLAKEIQKAKLEISIDQILMYQNIERLCLKVLRKEKKSSQSFPESQIIDTTEFESKKEFSSEKERTLLRILEENENITELLLINSVRKEYPVSPRQRIHLINLENVGRRNILFSYEFTYHEDKTKILAILQSIIKANCLFRSVIERKDESYYIKEFDSFSNLEIPFFDLSCYSDTSKDKAISLAKKNLQKNAFNVLNHILYRIALFKMDNSRSILIMTFNHLIFDGESRKILTEKLRQLEENNENAFQIVGKNLDYFDYINFLNKYNCEKCDIETFVSPSEFVQYRQKFLDKFINAELTSVLFEVKMSVMNETLKQLYNEIIFLSFAKSINYLFGINKVPLNFVYNGRNYKDGRFVFVIGDFHDVIPMLFSFFSSSSYLKQLRIFLDYRFYIKEKNLNFSNLYVKKYISGIEYPILDSPFIFNSHIGAYEILKSFTNQQILNSYSKDENSIFNIEIAKDVYSDKILINIVQNCGIEKHNLISTFNKTFIEVVHDLNESKLCV